MSFSPLSVVDVIMGGLDFMYELMYACMYVYLCIRMLVSMHVCVYVQRTGLLIAVAPRYRYCSGATFTVAVAVAPLLLAESSGESSAATFLAAFYRYSLPLLFFKLIFPLLISLRAFSRQSINFSRR